MSAAAFLALATLSAEPLTVERAVELALANSPTFKAVSQRVPEEQARGDAALALENPQLRVQNLRSDNLLTPGLTGQPSSAHPFGGTSLWLRWAPPNPWVGTALRAEARSRIAEAEAEVERARRTLIAEVKKRHAAVLSYDQQVALARQAVELKAQLAKLVRQQVARQSARALDEHLADLEALDARAQVTELSRKRREAMGELLVELGLGLADEPALAGEPPACLAPAEEAETLADRAAEADPTVRVHRARAAAAAAQRQEARMALVPWLDYLQAGYVLASDDRPAYGSLRFGVSLPLLNWNGRKVDMLSARRQQEDSEAEAALRKLRREVEDVLADVRDDAELVARYREAEPLLVAESGPGLDAALAAGASSLVEVAQLRAKSLAARRASLKAELHCQLALVELERLAPPHPQGVEP